MPEGGRDPAGQGKGLEKESVRPEETWAYVLRGVRLLLKGAAVCARCVLQLRLPRFQRFHHVQQLLPLCMRAGLEVALARLCVCVCAIHSSR